MTIQQLQELAILELTNYFKLPYEVQRKYAPMFSPYAVKFLYLENVSEKISKRKLNKGKLKGDVLRTEDGRLFTSLDIVLKELKK